jgi:type IV pilus assembly protein PilQ
MREITPYGWRWRNFLTGLVGVVPLFFSAVLLARDPFGDVQAVPATTVAAVMEHWYPLHHQPVQRVATLLLSVLGKLGAEEAVVSDDLRNGIWLHLTPVHWQQAQRYLPRWDTPTAQVDMVAYIVDMESSVMDELGVQWRQAPAKAAHGRGDNLTMDMPSENNMATVHIGVLDRKILALQLSALEQDGKGAIIARPHLLIEDNKEAVIEAGTEVPYSEKTKSGATNASFKKAVLRLKVRPRCLPDQRLLLALEVNHDKVSALHVQGTPAIETQGLTTEVAVASGQTVVLGGLFTVSQSTQIEQLPWLGRLPIVGGLFRWQSQQQSRKELVIFISPRVL